MSEIRVTSVVGENGSDPVGLSTGFTVGPTSGTTATITHEGQASFTGIVTATTFVPTVGQLSHRNIIVNGDMTIAQRGLTSTAEGYHTIDRIYQLYSGTDEAPTFAQADVTSGGAFDAGFRKCLKITNGNQTSGAGAGDRVRFEYRIEAQDLANSGWNYKSTSSYITLSFWVKSSVAQNFYARLYSADGTAQAYTFETGALTANTWTKVTKIIPGNTNIQFDNNTAYGMIMSFAQYAGSNYTDAGNTMNTWAAYSGSSRYPTNTSTWYTTNDATWEFTGLQFEVGSAATPFEHRSYGEELRRCQRYFFNITGNNGSRSGIPGYANSTTSLRCMVQFPAPMRAIPTVSGTATAMVFDSHDDSASFNCSSLTAGGAPTTSNPTQMCIEVGTSGMTNGQGGQLEFRADNGSINFSAEL